MKAGQLDRRITFESLTTTQNSIGEPVPSYSVYKTVAAAVLPDREREYSQNESIEAENTCIFRTRWFSGLRATMRIFYDRKYFDIVGFKEIGRQEGYEIVARARQS